MRSRRALGTIAIVAIVVAAISFAVVDIATSAASGCLDTSAPCAERSGTPVATVFAIVGASALVAAVIPAIAWLVQTLPGHPAARDADADVDYARRPPARTHDEDDEIDILTSG